MLDFENFLIIAGQVKTDPPDKVQIFPKPGHNKRRGTPPQQCASPLTYIMLDLRIYLIFPGQLKTDPPDKTTQMTLTIGSGHSGQRGGTHSCVSLLTYIMLDLEIFLIIPGQAKTVPLDKLDRTETAEKVCGSFTGSATPKGCTVDRFGLYLRYPLSLL